MKKPFVITIILNTNRREDTLACLESLALSTYENHKIIVLDNHSTDGSVQAINDAYPEVEVIALEENLGYAGNNNVGIEAALKHGADWVFVLNEDTIVAPDCISRLVEIGEKDLQTGIVGPMVYHHDEANVIQSAGGKLSEYWDGYHLGKNELDQGQFVEPHLVDWISGCAIMVRRAAIEQAGMIDAQFFYYWEETEWCLRTSRAGWRIVHVPAAKIWHKGVQRNYTPKPLVTYYSTRSHLFMLLKHHAPAAAWIYNWGQIFRTLMSWTIKPKWRSKRDHRDAMWRGLIDFMRHRWGQMSS
jgi:GT2 family glycosyltransferase